MGHTNSANRVILVSMCCIGITILFSCKPIASVIFNHNSNKTFGSRKDYLEYIERQYGIKQENIYIPDSSNRVNFIDIIIKNNIVNYYGTFKGSASAFRKSKFLTDNEGCIGRVLGDIELYTKTGVLTVDSLFYNIKFTSATDGYRAFPKHDLNTLVFVFSYKQGKINAKDLKEIQEKYGNNSDYQLLFLSLDPIPN